MDEWLTCETCYALVHRDWLEEHMKWHHDTHEAMPIRWRLHRWLLEQHEPVTLKDCMKQFGEEYQLLWRTMTRLRNEGRVVAVNPNGTPLLWVAT